MKEQIINTSANLFLSLGFKSVTMDDIAQNMGISKKTIYAHFPTKNQLIEAVTLFVLQKITEGIEDIKSKSFHPIEELFMIKEFTTTYLKDEKSSPQFQLEKYYPKIYREVNQSNHHLISCSIEDNLNRGIASGDYRPNIPIDFISKIYFVGISGLKDPAIFPPQLQGMKTLYDKFLEYHLRAITTPAGLEKLNQFVTNDF